jgi:hypothetical protein
MKNNYSSNTDGAVMTRVETAEFLRICKASLDKLPIPKIKAGRRILYRKAAVEAWLAKQEGTGHGQRS